jgi:hypothetical protein
MGPWAGTVHTSLLFLPPLVVLVAGGRALCRERP